MACERASSHYRSTRKIKGHVECKRKQCDVDTTTLKERDFEGAKIATSHRKSDKPDSNDNGKSVVNDTV